MKEIYENEIINSWVEDGENDEMINHRFKELSKIIDPMYDFILSYANYYSIRRFYGYGEKLTMLEAHYLTDIYDNPGITVTEIASKWKRSKSAISQTISKLLKWGYIEKIMNEEDAKVFNLSITPLGKKIVMAHKNYDNIDIIKTRKVLLKNFTVDELMAFDRVCKAYTEILHKSTNIENSKRD